MIVAIIVRLPCTRAPQDEKYYSDASDRKSAPKHFPKYQITTLETPTMETTLQTDLGSGAIEVDCQSSGAKSFVKGRVHNQSEKIVN